MDDIALNDGFDLPRLGLGVYMAGAGKPTRDAVFTALEVGYRLVDTASMYGNEKSVGEAVRKGPVPREDVVVTTKLWNSDHGYEPALRAFEKSRKELKLEQIDLYLIHWPVPEKRRDSWRALVKLQQEGLVRSIGVSNYTVKHLQELLATSDVPPSVNQVEASPFLQQRELRAFCAEHGIAVEAYSPLTRTEKMQHPAIQAAAKRLNRTPAQIMLRWAIEAGMSVLPKSVRPERIQENAGVFGWELGEDFAKLDEGFRTCWDPTGEA